MKKILLTVCLAGLPLLALAKLPTPVLSDEAKAKAAETAARTAWAGKVDAFKLCKVQDQVAAHYFKTAKAAGKETKPPTAAAACAEPGPFTYSPPVEAKPIEAAGAHSPSGTATSPPSTKQPDAVVNPQKKS
ncbi:MAG: hypothetical protein Q8M91_12080 [Polaromonas sp.]|nr:hypothetical protein [Polaromonas sp.]MDP3411665.1 hypothetical protein [Polaromonas sp.]MDP3606956.1 hypothetical protein [Polaromonas sp.]